MLAWVTKSTDSHNYFFVSPPAFQLSIKNAIMIPASSKPVFPLHWVAPHETCSRKQLQQALTIWISYHI